MIPVMAAIAAVQAIEQAQQAKKQQDIENSKIAYSSWTGMQPKAVQTPNNPFIEGAGGYIKDLEYADAQKDADMQRKYLAKRIDNLDNRDTANTWQAMDRVLGAKQTRGA